jgi:hypothetical protein
MPGKPERNIHGLTVEEDRTRRGDTAVVSSTFEALKGLKKGTGIELQRVLADAFAVDGKTNVRFASDGYKAKCSDAPAYDEKAKDADHNERKEAIAQRLYDEIWNNVSGFLCDTDFAKTIESRCGRPESPVAVFMPFYLRDEIGFSLQADPRYTLMVNQSEQEKGMAERHKYMSEVIDMAIARFKAEFNPSFERVTNTRSEAPYTLSYTVGVDGTLGFYIVKDYPAAQQELKFPKKNGGGTGAGDAVRPLP